MHDILKNILDSRLVNYMYVVSFFGTLDSGDHGAIVAIAGLRQAQNLEFFKFHLDSSKTIDKCQIKVRINLNFELDVV